ncbi:hypothetical protein BST61_g3998 [Cercospora zeina]
MQGRKDVEFQTLDGLTLRGWLFEAAERGPAIIMTPGFNMTKETIVADVAEYFFAAGFTMLSFDPRTIGKSDGSPRNECNPVRNMEDYHDALTYLKSNPMVDPTRIAFWGYSFSGMVALCATAVEKRAKAVVAVAPLTFCREAQPSFAPETTLSSYYHIAAFQPFPLLKFVSPTPSMVVRGEKDLISPTELQKELIYDVLSEPKRLDTIPGKAHMNIMSGHDSERVLDNQVNFLRQSLKCM